MIETIKFIMILPFKESMIFPLFIWLIFVVSLILNMISHKKRFNEYINNADNLIYDDWNEPQRYVSIPGILMSIGIIGTFYLIYSSLSHFQIDKIEEVSTIITNNIAPAFSVSALGIFASVLYVLIEKFFVLEVYSNKMQKIKVDKNSITYLDIATKQLLTSKKILDSTEIQTETFKSLSNFSNGLDEMSQSMVKFGDIAKTLEATLNPNVLGMVIAQAVNEEMKPILSRMQNVAENVDKNSEKLTYFLEEDLKNEIMIPLKNSVDNTSESMKSIEKALDKTSEAMIETNKGFDKLNISLDKLESLQENFVQKLDDVLEKQKNEFEKTTQTITSTYNSLADSVSNQIDKFNQNSKDITDSFTGLSTEMKEFLIGYKQDYKELLNNQEQAIKETSEKAVQILDRAGEVASKTIMDASEKLQSTLNGVDEALVKTSESITDKLTEFKNSYTDTLKGFLDSQADELHKVFGEHTEKLKEVVIGFKDTIERDVYNRKILNEDLEKLVKTTNGFVSSTQAMISTAFDEQQSQLISFMENNKSMQSKLTHIIENATNINDNGNILTKELIDTTANLSKQFNDNQIENLERYQVKVDEHLKDILNYMAAIIEASHINNDK
jgi:hypothetical protein